MPLAFTISLLSWGTLEFPKGYAKAGTTQQTLDNIKWGADWLVKAVGTSTNGSSNSSGIIYQTGNLTTDMTVSPSFSTRCLGDEREPITGHVAIWQLTAAVCKCPNAIASTGLLRQCQMACAHRAWHMQLQHRAPSLVGMGRPADSLIPVLSMFARWKLQPKYLLGEPAAESGMRYRTGSAQSP